MPESRAVGTAFVLGGGGVLGASEVGMLRALTEAGIRADLVLGTSIGALNGALYARAPHAGTVARLEALWTRISDDDVFAGSPLRRVSTLARTKTHVHGNDALRELLERELGEHDTFEALEVPFQCVAASIERAAEHWFTAGPLVPAVLASCAVPGILPPVEVGGEHYLDGGLVDSIPVGRAVALGARTIYVLQVGRVERPLEPPRRPWEVAMVAFEIARRHRFAADMAAVPHGVEVHLLPVGDPEQPKYSDLSALSGRRYRDTTRVAERIALAHRAGADYLAGLPAQG